MRPPPGVAPAVYGPRRRRRRRGRLRRRAGAGGGGWPPAAAGRAPRKAWDRGAGVWMTRRTRRRRTGRRRRRRRRRRTVRPQPRHVRGYRHGGRGGPCSLAHLAAAAPRRARGRRSRRRRSAAAGAAGAEAAPAGAARAAAAAGVVSLRPQRQRRDGAADDCASDGQLGGATGGGGAPALRRVSRRDRARGARRRRLARVALADQRRRRGDGRPLRAHVLIAAGDRLPAVGEGRIARRRRSSLQHLVHHPPGDADAPGAVEGRGVHLAAAPRRHARAAPGDGRARQRVARRGGLGRGGGGGGGRGGRRQIPAAGAGGGGRGARLPGGVRAQLARQGGDRVSRHLRRATAAQPARRPRARRHPTPGPTAASPAHPQSDAPLLLPSRRSFTLRSTSRASSAASSGGAARSSRGCRRR